MGLPRDLVRLEAELRSRSEIDLFSKASRDVVLETPEAAGVREQMQLIQSSAAVRVCLQALRIQYSELAPQLIDAELVATLPPDAPGLARPTERVVHEMLSRATSEVILVGYEFTELALLEHLAKAATRGVEIFMICDRARGGARRVQFGWPKTTTARPRIFQDRLRTDAAPYASMHAKCLVVDANELLITSANFTFHGMRGNIEIGVRLTGMPASEARKIFSHLVEAGVVEEVSADMVE